LLQPKKTILLLEYPDVVKSPITGNPIGRWSMVYDEGFEIFLEEEEKSNSDDKVKIKENFFAFSKYNINKDITPKDDDDEKSEGYVSECS